MAEFRHWPKSGHDAVRLSANRRENRHPGPPECSKKSFLAFKGNSDAVILHSTGPSAVFRTPRNLYSAVGPRVAIGFNFRSIPQSRFRFSRSVPDAAGCRTPHRRSPTGGRPPSDLRSRSRSRPQEESGRQGLAVLSPATPHPRSREPNSTEPPAGEFAVFGSPVAGWMPLEVTPSPVTSPCCHSRWGGVVQAWLELGYGFQRQPAAGDKMDHDVP